ncbi:MAG: DUF4167 domain-containing protein [Rhizomicrobium sp.]
MFVLDRGKVLKRSRRGGRRPQHAGGGGGGHNNNNNNGGGGGHNPNRTFDSSGPEVKIRGSASNVYEKYLQLARDANASGDRVMAENYLQHAEHYYRIMAAQAQAQAQYQQQQAAQQQNNNGNRQANGQGETPYVQQPPNQSAASFSLTENEEEGEEEAAE